MAPPPAGKLPAWRRTQARCLRYSADQILSAKASDPGADTRELEREIDQLVYALYGLTEEEIGIVEGEAGKF